MRRCVEMAGLGLLGVSYGGVLFLFLFLFLKTRITIYYIIVIMGFNDAMIVINGFATFVFIGVLFVWFKKWCKKPVFKEGWSADTMTSFNNYKTTSLPSVQFNMGVLQKQTDDSDVQYLIDHGHWKWSDDTKQIYQNAMSSSSSTKGDPGIVLVDTQKTYNENAVKQALAWDTKEGQFLIYGVSVTSSSKKKEPAWVRTDNASAIYKCAEDCNGEPRIQYFGESNSSVVVPLEELPNQIPGFQFVRGVCNPCEALEEDAQYNCPFTIQTTEKDIEISEVWSNLWGI